HLAASSQDAMARDDQRHGVPGHGLADVVRRFRAGTELLRQGAVGRGVTPTDTPRRGVDLLEELWLLIEVKPDGRKIDLLACEVSFHGGDDFRHLCRGRARFRVRQSPKQTSFDLFSVSTRQLEPRNADIVPCDTAIAARRLENTVNRGCPVHVSNPASSRGVLIVLPPDSDYSKADFYNPPLRPDQPTRVRTCERHRPVVREPC